MRRIFLWQMLIAMILLQGLTLSNAATPSNTKPKLIQGVFTDVTGKVIIKSKSGKTSIYAKKGYSVKEGQSIITRIDSKATLQLFDGSQLNIDPNTKFQLTKLQKPSSLDKIIQFKLLVGKLLATVKKLASSKSSFEIEAGGVVCGVRGTQFSEFYNPDTHTLNINVFEGAVYTNFGGNTNIYKAGQQINFIDGQPVGNPSGNSGTGSGTNNPGPNSGGNNNGTQGNFGGIDGLTLGDLNNQFTNGLLINGDNTITDPAVEGSIKLNVHVNVSGY